MKLKPVAPIAALVALAIVATIVTRRRGTRAGGNTVMRCRSGHLFTTVWVPGASRRLSLEGQYLFSGSLLPAGGIGILGVRYCPVGKHWTLVTRLEDSDLTDEDRRIASENRDLRTS